MASRTLPVSSPSVMRPCRSTMVTWLTSRVVMVIIGLGASGRNVSGGGAVRQCRYLCRTAALGCPDERSSTDDQLAELQLITELRPRSAKTTPLYNPVFPESEK